MVEVSYNGTEVEETSQVVGASCSDMVEVEISLAVEVICSSKVRAGT